jgi:hypothetical protein
MPEFCRSRRERKRRRILLFIDERELMKCPQDAHSESVRKPDHDGE